MSDVDELNVPPLPHPYPDRWDELNDFMRYYDKSGNRVTCSDYLRLQAFDDDSNHSYARVGFDRIGEYEVSTVWLGMDHSLSFYQSTPLIFETMVFAPDRPHDPGVLETLKQWNIDLSGQRNLSDLECVRYSTLQDAEEGHQRMVEQVRLFVSLAEGIEDE